METSFHYDLADKSLNFKLKERLTAKPGIELKGKGLFNTATGGLSYDGTLKGVYKTRAELKDEGSTPWKLGGGLYLSNANKPDGFPTPQLHASAKKTVSLFEGPRTTLTSKAWVNVDPVQQQFTDRRASVKLAHKWMGFTKRQDLKLAAGLDLSWPVRAAQPQGVPFVQVKENNWAVHYRNKRCFMTYDL